MSGREHPHDVIAVLYQHAEDSDLPVLDELLIRAGYMRRCPCGATPFTDSCCEVCGRDEEDDGQADRCQSDHRLG